MYIKKIYNKNEKIRNVELETDLEYQEIVYFKGIEILIYKDCRTFKVIYILRMNKKVKVEA